MSYERKDHYYRRAKAAGYRSRAAYKLLDLARRHRLIRPGDHVLDLGAWPGGWVQVAAELAGPQGRVIGVDLVPIAPLALPGLVLLQGDVREPSTVDRIVQEAGGRIDVVLSDMAPKLSGVRATDEARSAELVSTALAIAHRLLRSGGRFLAKAFMGSEVDRLQVEMRDAFAEVKRAHSAASRSGSAEIYLVGIGFRSIAQKSSTAS